MFLSRWKFAISRVILVLATVPSAVVAAEADLESVARERKLAVHPVWLRLLHYGRDGKSSDVITTKFFLSPHGRHDPQAELSATIKAYFLPWGEDANQHARCRFPARYFWLAKQITLPDYRLHEPRCQRLAQWALFDRVQSISVLQVSGYFGNPASMFGHALIKFNTNSPDDKEGFFDLSLNFGALVPENEATLVYVVRGLFGGYKAGFSDKYFYTQDLVYSRTEFRDIWEYELSLSDDARTLFVLHVWEIIANENKYAYYFLTKNCAFRLAELLELVTGEIFTDSARVWYVPSELFHRLIDVDKRRIKSGSSGLISSTRFIPSSQRVLQHQFGMLSPTEINAANEIISSNPIDVRPLLDGFQHDRQSEILDALLTYYQYRLVAEQPKSNEKLRDAKDRILRARLQYPGRTDTPSVPPALPSPAEGSRPMMANIGVGRNQDGENYWRARWSPFSRELAGNHGAVGDELVVMDLALGAERDGGAYLDSADFLSIRKLNTAQSPIAGESRLSWELNFGARRVVHAGEVRVDAQASYGIGRAWKWSDNTTVYAMADLSGHRLAPNIRFRPHVGLVGGTGSWRMRLLFGVENSDEGDGWREVRGGIFQYHLSRNQALRLELSNEAASRASVSLSWYW